jgi:hypothetical protein
VSAGGVSCAEEAAVEVVLEEIRGLCFMEREKSVGFEAETKERKEAALVSGGRFC